MNTSSLSEGKGPHDTYSPPACHIGSRILPAPGMTVLNVAAYRFVALDGLPQLRNDLHQAGSEFGLRGTILLAPEGINLFLAGSEPGVHALRQRLDADCRLAGLDYKESWSVRTPFKRLKVKIKDEIISFGVPGIDPGRDPAPAIAAATLESWLDEGREVILLDTRNTFEVAHGTFSGAVHLGNDSFRGFAALAGSLPISERDIPVVAFCTGGIRCEKAAPLLRQLGHQHVLQLSGGILRYFEEVGSAHYEGACFVFDERAGLDAGLTPHQPLPPQLQG